MRRCLAVFVLCCLTLGVTARADEHVVSGNHADTATQWVYGGRRSLVTGATPQPGNDGPWRVHVKVKNGDLVLFTDSTVVFENGKDEVDKVWEVAEFLDGSTGKLGPLTDSKQKAFYKSLHKALLTDEPSKETGRPLFLIRIKALTADRPILFSSGRVSHIDQARGNKHFMFGAIELDTISK
jgi:hypothetical protein